MTQVSDGSATSVGTPQTSNKTDASKDDSFDPTILLNPEQGEDSTEDFSMEASFIESMPSDLPLPVPAPLSTPGVKNAKEEAVRLNLAASDHQTIFSICAPEVFRLRDHKYAVFSMRLPTPYTEEHVSVDINKRQATLLFTKPVRTLDTTIICGVLFEQEDTVIHSAIDSYLAKRRRSVDEAIVNKLVLNLPFEAEPQLSNDVLLAGFQNIIMSSPDNCDDNASRLLVLTFKQKETNYTVNKKVTKKVAAPSTRGFVPGYNGAKRKTVHGIPKR